MRYIVKKSETGNWANIIDSKPEVSYDNEIVTVHEIKRSKIDRINLVHKSLNLRAELGSKPEKKTKAELLTIIKKYI